MNSPPSGVFLFVLLCLLHRASPYYYGAATAPSKPVHAYRDLINVFGARNLEFGFPSERERQAALRQGRYKPDTPLPIDVDVFYPNNGVVPTVFITIPRFGEGVPYSLAYLTNNPRPNGTEIQAFPSYDWHSSHGANCDGLTSVYRVQIDSCGQMWILDSGEIDFKQFCAPQIVVMNLNSGQMVHRYRLPAKMFKPTVSRFVTPLVDIADSGPYGRCEKAFVYMADPTGFGLVVYDVAQGRSWRIENKYTYPNPDYGTHTIAGDSFQLLDGILGLSVTPRNLGLERMLYFHALSSDTQAAVPLEALNNETLWLEGGVSASLDKFVEVGKRGVQCGPSAMTAHGFLLSGFLEPIAIVGWNIRTRYINPNLIVLAKNPVTLQFVSGLKVIRDPSGRENVWMLSNRLQKAFTGTTNYAEINYRIQRCDVDALLLGLSCRP